MSEGGFGDLSDDEGSEGVENQALEKPNTGSYYFVIY